MKHDEPPYSNGEKITVTLFLKATHQIVTLAGHSCRQDAGLQINIFVLLLSEQRYAGVTVPLSPQPAQQGKPPPPP
jgi:hypothetical protein